MMILKPLRCTAPSLDFSLTSFVSTNNLHLDNEGSLLYK
nr:hypothetical protein Q903MT_gene2246 [Picea sitchensis]